MAISAISGKRLFRGGPAMRAHGFGDQPQSAHQQDEHEQGIEKRLRPEIDVHVGDYAGQDEQRSGGGEQPSDRAAPVEKQDGHAEQQRNERDAEAVGASETPVRAYDGHLVGDQVSADTGHHKAQNEFSQAAGRAANIAHRTVLHAVKDSRKSH